MISSIEEFSVGTEQGSVSAHLEKLKLMRENILRSPEGMCTFFFFFISQFFNCYPLLFYFSSSS